MATLVTDNRSFPARIFEHPIKIGWLQPHLNTVGGIRRVIEMTNRLLTHGATPVIITPDGQKSDWLPINADVITCETAAKETFDILICSDPDMSKEFFSLKASLRINYHLAAYMLYRKGFFRLRRYYRKRPEILHIANSGWTARMLQQHRGIECSAVFHGGIDRNLFHPVEATKKYDLVCYGSDRPHKGTATIIEASKGYTLLKLSDLNCSQSDLSKHICSGRIFVSACWHEGFNFCPLEAMACGVPVVMTDDGGSADYARDGYNALVVPPKEPLLLAAAIERLMSDDSLQKKLIENGFKTSLQFDWDRIGNQFAVFLDRNFRG